MARVLVIDDEDSIRNMLVKMLQVGGHDVISAGDGEEGLLVFQEHPTDIVITDLLMPKKEGIETIMELQKLSPKLKIIAISGGGRGAAEDYLGVATDMEVYATFSKPFAMQALLAAVAEIDKQLTS